MSRFIHLGDKSFNGYEYNVLFRQLEAFGDDGRAAFIDVAHLAQADRIEDGRALGVSDVDHDGDLDLIVQNYKSFSRLLINEGGGGNWLELRLTGTRSNRDAIGARVAIRHGGRKQTREVTCGAGYLSGQSLAVHFGLGDDERVDHLTIRWPSGAVDELTDVPANQRMHLTEGSPESRAVTSRAPAR